MHDAGLGWRPVSERLHAEAGYFGQRAVAHLYRDLFDQKRILEIEVVQLLASGLQGNQPVTQIQSGRSVTGSSNDVERLGHRRDLIVAVLVTILPRRRRCGPHRVALAIHQFPPEATDGARVFNRDFPDAKS